MTEPDPGHEPARLAAESYLTRARADIVRGSLWTATATIVTVPLTFLASVFVARSLGPEGFGRFATYVAVFTIGLTLTNLGWSEATIQWLSAANARGDEVSGSALIRRCAGYHLWVAGPASAATVFFLLASYDTITALAAAAVAWGIQILGTSTVVLTAGARNASSAQIALVATTAAQLGLLTTAVATRDPGLTWTVLLAFLLIGPAIAVAALRPSERKALLRPQFSLRVPEGFLVYALSACAAGLVATLVFGRSEILILRGNGLLGAVGVFTVATGLAGQVTGPVDSLMAPLTPIAAGVYAVDEARACRSFERALRVSAALGTAVACVIVPILVTCVEPLYGTHYSPAVLPFLLLGLVSCLQTALGPVASFAFATRSASKILKANLICLLVDAVLAVSLVPVIGLWGAVVANSVAQIVSLLVVTAVVTRKLGLRLKQIAADVRLFAIGLTLGTGEGLVCAALAGPERLLAPAVVLAGVGCLWLMLWLSPPLRFAADDLALVARGSKHRIVLGAIRLLQRAGVVQDGPG